MSIFEEYGAFNVVILLDAIVLLSYKVMQALRWWRQIWILMCNFYLEISDLI